MIKSVFRAIYQRLLGRKFFNKIMVTYIVVVIFALMSLSFIISNSVTSKLQEEYSNYNRQAIYALQAYLQRKVGNVNRIVSMIYDDNRTFDTLFGLLDAADGADYLLAHKRELAETMTSLTLLDPDIQDIILYKGTPEMAYLYRRGDTTLFQYPYLIKPYYQLRYHIEGKKFVSRHENIYASQDQSYTFGIINNLVYPVTGVRDSKMMINFNFNAISDLYSSYAPYVKGYILILTDDGTVLFDSSGHYYGRQYPYFDDVNQSGGFLKLDEECFVDVIRTGEYGVTCISVIPQSVFTRNIESLRITMFAISLLCIAMIVVLYAISTRIFSRRVKAIIDVMNQVGENNLSPRIPVKGEDDEIGRISRIFNQMCDNLQNYIEKVYITEIKQRRMELKALQAQVNPHFLYNTLEAIRMGLYKEGNEESAEMIYYLAELFRASLRSEAIVSLHDELEYCRIYLELFSIRYGNKLSFRIEAQEDIGEYGMIKHLLQPLIENYIVHGFSGEKDQNRIIIKASVQERDIMIVIADNGSGIPEDRLATLQDEIDRDEASASDGIGLKNVNDRIKLVYGRQYGLQVSSSGQGTEVTMKIPCKSKEELKRAMQLT